MINNTLLWLIITLVATWILYQLSPALTPFVIAGILAYLVNPIINLLANNKMSRTVAIIMVFLLLLIVALVMFLLILPLLLKQTISLFDKLPGYLLAVESILTIWLAKVGISIQSLDTELLQRILSDYGIDIVKLANNIISNMTQSGIVILQWLINLVLIPVVTFYLLLDYDGLIAKGKALLPQRYTTKVTELLSECNAMLAAFMRGQLMVMLALTILYITGLTLIGIDAALLVGIIAGVLSFVPYLGLTAGIGLAGMVAFFQFYQWLPVLMVVCVFAIVQIIESVLLTPYFVGNRISLHPVAVIFAIMAGGQLFGFIGVLLALPAATVFMVLLRHLHQYYLTKQ